MDEAALHRGALRLLWFGMYVLCLGAGIQQATHQTQYSTLALGVVGVVGVGAALVASAVNRRWRGGRCAWVLSCVEGISWLVACVGVDVGLLKSGFGDVLAHQAFGAGTAGLVFVIAGIAVLVFVDYEAPVPALPGLGVQEPKKGGATPDATFEAA